MEGVPEENSTQGAEKAISEVEFSKEQELASWIKDHPGEEVPYELRRDPEEEIAEFLTLVSRFESEYPLDALHSITDLSPETAPSHPLRQPAKIALEPIVRLLNSLKAETTIPTFDHDGLRAKYKRLSRAVGIICRGKVDHTR
jgi:hypothetical protein